MGVITILARLKDYFIRISENMVQHSKKLYIYRMFHMFTQIYFLTTRKVKLYKTGELELFSGYFTVKLALKILVYFDLLIILAINIKLVKTKPTI